MKENTRQIGSAGEAKAFEWLILQGFKIIAQNYRKRTFEIDLIALKNNVIHFIEVKTVKKGTVDDAVFGVISRNLPNYVKGISFFLAENQNLSKKEYCIDVLIVSLQGFRLFENITMDLGI